jgi:DUF971 family protein
MNQPILIKCIEQKDTHTFFIEWSDRKLQVFRLSEVQKHCPCAYCVDEKTGQRLSNAVQKDVKAYSIRSVGRYAIQIKFTSGCSTGIYSFDQLRQIGQSYEKK